MKKTMNKIKSKAYKAINNFSLQLFTWSLAKYQNALYGKERNNE
jgi:hypothetical protein